MEETYQTSENWSVTTLGYLFNELCLSQEKAKKLLQENQRLREIIIKIQELIQTSNEESEDDSE